MKDVVLERARLQRSKSLCNEACKTIALQVRRLRSKEPEDDTFVFRYWADLQFLIVSLRRLRSAALIANFVPEVAQAVRAFDRALPALREMRNVGEHIDAYAVDDPKRFHKEIGRRDLQVGTWDGTTFSWLTGGLNIDDALRAAELLFQAIRTANERAAAMRRNDA